MRDRDRFKSEAALALKLRAAPPLVLLGEHNASVWLISLVKCRSHMRELSCILGEEERRRACMLRNAQRRRAYVAAHALLRIMLSTLSEKGIAPDLWRFRVGRYGKPCLSAPLPPEFEFNLSYAEQIAAIAVSSRCQLGIDIEAVLPARTSQIPWSVLSPVERRVLRGVPVREQFAEFLKIWTLKEAYSKCRGFGVSRNFCDVRVTLDPLAVVTEPWDDIADGDVLLHQEIIQIDHARYILAVVAIPTRRSDNAPPAAL